MQDVIVWSGWVGGLAVGTYMVAQLLITGKALGASTGFGNVCALASKHPFFRRGAYADRSSWRLWFTLGIPILWSIAHIILRRELSTTPITPNQVTATQVT